VVFKEMSKLTKEVRDTNHTIEVLEKRVSTMTTRIQQPELNLPKTEDKEEESFDDADHPEDTIYIHDGTIDHKMTSENHVHRTLARNRKGMGGNKTRHNYVKNDPYAKVKFTIPYFYGRYDAKEYLD
jgi:hypothetical protein